MLHVYGRVPERPLRPGDLLSITAQDVVAEVTAVTASEVHLAGRGPVFLDPAEGRFSAFITSWRAA